MSDLIITEKQIVEVRAEIVPVLDAAKAMVVVDEVSYLRALELGRMCDQKAKHVESVWKDAREKAHGAWKAITETISSFTKPLGEARTIVTRKATDWEHEDAQRKRVTEQTRQAEEQRRIENERLRQADELVKAGKVELADRVMEKEIVVAPQKIEEAPKPEKTTIGEKWQFEITEEVALPREYLTPNLVKIGQIVRALKGETRIPGVRVFDAGKVIFRK